MRTYFTILFASLLAACNNGGSFAAPATTPALAPSDVAITTDNALAAAQAGVRGSLDLMRLCYLGAQFLQTPQPEEPGGEPTVLGTLLSMEVPGPQGGTATFSWNNLDEDGHYSSGDLFTISFDMYGVEGMMLDGVMTIDNINLQGLLPGDGTYLLEANLNFLGLTAMIGASAQAFTMTMPFRMENRIIIEIFELLLLENQVVGIFEVQRSSSMVRYESNEAVRFQLHGAVHSPELDGTVRFHTPTYLVGSPFLSDPTDGTLHIRGANRSLVEIEPFCIVPGVCLSLDVRVDEDGDEEFEATLSSSWAALLPQ